MSLHTAAGQQHQPYTVEGLLMWEQWQWSSGWKIILIYLQYIDEDEWYENLSESEDHHGWRVTHNAWHYDDNDGGGDDDHAASDVCDGDGDVCRGEDDFQKLLKIYLYKYFCSILPVIHMYCNSFEKRFIPHRIKQRKHMDLDGCLSNIFPYLPMFLIFLASSFCWKRYASFNNQQKSATAQPAVFSQHWGDLCPEGRQLLWARHSPRTYGKVARYNFAKSLSPQKLLRCAVFSLEVRFCSRELCEYYCTVDMCLIPLSHRYVYIYLHIYLNPPREWNFSPLNHQKTDPRGWILTPLEGLGIYTLEDEHGSYKSHI